VGEDRSQTSRQRVTVAQAAEILGVTVEAVRGRIKRGTLEHERHSGTVYALLPADQMPTGRQPGDDQAADRPRSDGNALISEMRDRIEFLEHQLELERQANSEHRRLLAAALERIPPQLEAPQDAPEDAETVEDEPEEAGTPSAAEEAREELSTERARREMAETTMHEGMAEERREEAERERDELRRELYARSREVPEAAETGEEQQGRGEPRPAERGAQETSESLAGRGSGTARGSLWRRLFGR
jgi:type IV secretory pathway VirB10-like protein